MPSKLYTIWLNPTTYIVVDFQSLEGELLAFVVRLVRVVGDEHLYVARYDTAMGLAQTLGAEPVDCPLSAEAQFDALALAAWADESVDENTDWERHVGLKPQHFAGSVQLKSTKPGSGRRKEAVD